MNRIGVTPRFAAVFGAITLAAALCALLLRTGWGLAVFLYLLLLIATLLDFFLTPGKRWFSATRDCPVFEQTRPGTVTVTVKSAGVQTLRLRLADSAPSQLEGDSRSPALSMEHGEVHFQYTLRPTSRGVYSFGKCYAELPGRWGLALRRFALDCPGSAVVHPNLGPMRHYRMLAERKQLHREDSSIHRIRGIGTEFVGLKEYAAGDDWRKVNWKATARAGKLMTNIYDVEKNRDVIVAVDMGRWMQASTRGITRLDRALELAAAILQVAISNGDQAGLVLFDAETSCYLAPGKGIVHMRRLLSALYGARPSPAATSYAALSATLHKKLSKRAFVCTLTYLDHPEEAQAALTELAPIRRRHSVFFASITDVGLDALIEKETAVSQDIYLKTAAAYRKVSTMRAVDVLTRHGIRANASEPSELLSQSVHQYLLVCGMPR